MILIKGTGTVVKVVAPVTTIRVVLSPVEVKVVAGGPRGDPGPPGPPGTNAGKRWYGEGEPGVIIGSSPGDEYVDTITGNLYVLS